MPCPSPIINANQIISYEPIGVYDVYDFCVPNFHNYIAGGIIHHNSGKTYCAAAETAFHMTGDYPDWWEGHRFQRPPLMWAGSITNLASRDICQRELLGETLGHGTIPGNRIIGQPTYRQAGIPNVADMVRVKHASGGTSALQFKTYEQGWRVWQGSPVDGIWLDEEPDESSAQKGIFNEALTRILSTRGIIYCTFTPLLGETDLVLHFMSGKPGTHVTMATWDQAPHLDPVMKAQLLQSYPEWERDTRSKGVPMMGEGRVWKVNEDEIKCRPFDIPDHYARIVGIDFGTDHPFAAAWLAWDRDNDVLYVYDVMRISGQTPTYHAEGIKRRGAEIPVAWPHDGVNTEKSSGKALYLHYRDAGLNMLGFSARYENDIGGGQPVEPIVMDFDERFRTGGLKVFSHLHEWFEEYRSYHRKDGKIVPVKDDLLKATMYGAMMKRYAVPKIIRRRVKHYKGPIVASPV